MTEHISKDGVRRCGGQKVPQKAAPCGHLISFRSGKRKEDLQNTKHFFSLSLSNFLPSSFFLSFCEFIPLDVVSGMATQVSVTTKEASLFCI